LNLLDDLLHGLDVLRIASQDHDAKLVEALNLNLTDICRYLPGAGLVDWSSLVLLAGIAGLLRSGTVARLSRKL
jgi:hypothetical protein